MTKQRIIVMVGIFIVLILGVGSYNYFNLQNSGDQKDVLPSPAVNDNMPQNSVIL